MESLLQPAELLRRIQLFVEDETHAGRLPKGAFHVLREAVLAGEVDCGHARELTGYRERMGSSVISKLPERGLLESSGPKDLLHLRLTLDVIDRWFPRLYPAGA
jgi:hypothetical protein